jgi:hypothetical protein
MAFSDRPVRGVDAVEKLRRRQLRVGQRLA